jgi:hypothetical protein
VVDVVMSVFTQSYESFIQLIIAQNKLLGFEKLMGKLMLEEQRREVRFGGTGENGVLLVRTGNFKSGTKNF